MSIARDTILITGASGMLGTYITFGMPTTRKTLNVEDLASVRTFFNTAKPKVIFHFAAATDLVACEKNPEIAYRANALGTYNVALAAQEIEAKVAFVSTSAVFDGKQTAPYKEEDMPQPFTQYGHSKYMGELVVSGMNAQNIIARTCWMFGGGPNKDHKFVANIIRQLGKPQIEVIGGKKGSPTYGKDFVETLLSLVDQGKTGLFHVGNSGAPTRVDIAREIVAIVGSKTTIVEVDAAVFEGQYPGAGSRGNESIASSKVRLRPWQEALREYIETEWKTLL